MEGSGTGVRRTPSALPEELLAKPTICPLSLMASACVIVQPGVMRRLFRLSWFRCYREKRDSQHFG